MDRKLDNPEKDNNDTKPSHLIGVGASAGGLEALQEFFSGMPLDTGATFVVVQHLSPDYKSMMSELLLKHTKMPIYEVTDSVVIEANAIYLMPPRNNMMITEGKLLLSDQMPDHSPHMSIDVFFRSIAEDQQHRAVGIILSGTGSDGTKGIKAIKEGGGLVIVQDPESAKFDGMPKSAINTEFVDIVLKPSEIGRTLANYIHQPVVANIEPAITLAAEGKENVLLNEIFKLLKHTSSINFSLYKPATVARRIERRLSINELTSLEEYLALLNDSPKELQILSKELLIGVTRFFRDDEAFIKLAVEILPAMINGSETKPIRVWIAACSTGEEAYSIAILFDEILKKLNSKRQFKIFATDVDEDAITQASMGLYSADIAQEVSKERLQKYFVQTQDGYHVSPKIRQNVIFAVHNMIEDPPFSNTDLVSCRNALIYFQNAAQKKVLSSFYFALKQFGYLFLGSSESLGELQHHFVTVEERAKIFQKSSDARIALPHADLRMDSLGGNSDKNEHFANGSSPHSKTLEHKNKLELVMERLVKEYAPDCIVLNEDFEAEHIYGDVSKYTKGFSGGAISTNIKNILLEELKVAVSTALYRSEKNNEDVYYTDIVLNTNTEPEEIDLAIFVAYENHTKNSPRYFVLQFINKDSRPLKSKDKVITFNASEQSQQRIDDLESELFKKQEHLQITVEELETTNEELQSSNEELMSANEELQSTNEELQSVNEELYTVNSEYQEKIDQLTEANLDLDSVINSTDIGIVFLDANLSIRKFTPQAVNYINLRASDLGRPIHHISHQLENANLFENIATVSNKKITIEDDILTTNGEAILLKIMPYLPRDKNAPEASGVLIIITNISRLRFIEKSISQAKDHFKNMLIDRSSRLNHRIEKNEDVTVLVVDDDDIDRESVKRMLKSINSRAFTVIEANNTEEALETSNKVKIDVCLLDYRLADGTAEDFTRKLKIRQNKMPIVLFSSQSEQSMSQSFLHNDIVDFINKEELSAPLLARSIDYALDRQEIKSIVEKFEI